MPARTMTPEQERKAATIPRRYRRMYELGVMGNRPAALRYHCLECVAWVAPEVELCTALGCVCYPYRMTGRHHVKRTRSKSQTPARISPDPRQ